MNATDVSMRLAQPIEQDDDGQWKCRICPKTFEQKNSVPVHELVHRRAVGLAPPPMKGGSKAAPPWVVCGYDGCDARMKRSSLISHMQGKTHNMNRTDAAFYARQRNEEDRRGEPVTIDVVPTEPEPVNGHIEPPDPYTDISAVEAVTGILCAARTDKMIPARLLPHAVELIEHTEAVLTEMRRLAKT